MWNGCCTCKDAVQKNRVLISPRTGCRYIAENPDKCVVDPINRLAPLLDRSATRTLLEDLEDMKVSERTVVRAPRSVEVVWSTTLFPEGFPA